MTRFDLKRAALFTAALTVMAATLFGLLVGSSLGWFDRPGTSAKTLSPHVSTNTRETGQTSAPAIAAQAPSQTAGPRMSPRPPAEDPGLRLQILEEENRRLTAEAKDLRGRLVAVLNWILTNFKGKYPLPESLMERLEVPPVTEDYTLNPEAAALVKVTPEEAQKINDIFAYARTYLAEIEAALLTVTSPRPDKVILHIPPFVEDGRALREDLYAALEITLGPTRFDRFLKVTESGLKSSFYRFGEASRTLVFELVYAGETEPPQLKIKEGWIMDTAPGIRKIEATESTGTNLPARYVDYSPWLPEFMVHQFPAEKVR